VRQDVQRAFNDSLQKKFDKSVWKSDGSVYRLPCTSWYVHASGKHTALWPSFSATYWLAMRRADSSHYLPSARIGTTTRYRLVPKWARSE